MHRGPNIPVPPSLSLSASVSFRITPKEVPVCHQQLRNPGVYRWTDDDPLYVRRASENMSRTDPRGHRMQNAVFSRAPSSIHRSPPAPKPVPSSDTSLSFARTHGPALTGSVPGRPLPCGKKLRTGPAQVVGRQLTELGPAGIANH